MKQHKMRGIFLTFGVFAVEFLITALWLYPKSKRGELLSVRRASSYLPEIFIQSVIPFLFPAGLLILFALLLKKEFVSAFYLTHGGKWQLFAEIILCVGAMGLTSYCLIVKEDKISVLFSFLYYFVFISFAEEFVCRDVCPFFLRDFTWPVRYLIPNIGFAILHVFAYADWGEITGEYLLHFVSSELPGLAAMGCLLQLLKERSGTIWLPVLIHGLMDHSIVLKY